MTEQTTALITGANKGMGYETAVGLGRLGWSIGVGARDQQRREAAVARLRAEGIDAFGVALDVTDDESVDAAARLLSERGGLDVLVNNAAISGGRPVAPTETDLDTVRTVLETNVLGIVRVTNAMLPLLRRSSAPRVVNISSSVGSLALQSDPAIQFGVIDVAYSASKTFLNAITVRYAKELREAGVLVNAVCPGFVATELNGFTGFRTPAEGAAIAIRLAQLANDGPSGGFFNDEGVVPW
jgi:NAD(P)-dependent dehydrogenase (short-subunit alcohol dehydrogenase family)